MPDRRVRPHERRSGESDVAWARRCEEIRKQAEAEARKARPTAEETGDAARRERRARTHRNYERGWSIDDHIEHLIYRLKEALVASGVDYTAREALEGRAVRVLEGVAIALRRRDHRALQEPDRWAIEYREKTSVERTVVRAKHVDGKIVDGPKTVVRVRQTAGSKIGTRLQIRERLLRIAQIALAKREDGSALNSPAVVAAMMVDAIDMHGLCDARSEGLHDGMRDRLREAFKRSLERGQRRDVDEQLVELALVACGVVSSPAKAIDWLKPARRRAAE